MTRPRIWLAVKGLIGGLLAGPIFVLCLAALLGVFRGEGPFGPIWDNPALWIGLSLGGGALAGLLVGLLARIE
jgi:hypothetical protein